jgi:thymidylate synthase (FAD)
MKVNNQKIGLLDHGFIRLVDSMGSDLAISRNARVSYDAAWRAGEDEGSDAKLISYLFKNGHNTPFESVELQFEVMAPLFVLRQWHRHRTWSYNELSARYKELPEMFYVPEPRLIGVQSEDNKQMRTPLTELEYEALSDVDKECLKSVCVYLQEANTQSFAKYKQMIVDGIPRELARSVLPLATYSHMFAKVNLGNLFKFLGERLHNHAQYEIRVYAVAILELVKPIAPVAVKCFTDSLAGNPGYSMMLES